MNNLFAMVTMKSSNFYTNFAIKSFFMNTILDESDELLLIDNDKNDLSNFSSYKKIKIIKNKKPLSFAENVNQGIELGIQSKKNLIFLNNDIIFTKDWFKPIQIEENDISIPACNQLFAYNSDCGKLKLKFLMKFEDFNENYYLLNEIVQKHKLKFKVNLKFQTHLMPFYCFKIPYKILLDVGKFDTSFGKGGGEDIDYRIRCAIQNYGVNFLTDSYLLHFQGKSTWDGAESLKETEKRNKIYIDAFKKKWGEKMCQFLIIRKNFSQILSEKNLDDLYKKGQFTKLIKLLSEK
ncbi:MAG: hypothetical protein CBC24_04350 [Candidatus Pelagibacter sp. TMED64]|nr:hypothetical protein [Candidatus Pelagibacter sp.]OUU65893.1 MAG: hypothetical protein CBC24_04350 [Candidatus Pelagibacter sp. TMED64]|tara:strand:+ start:2486 stop:3364 length:879 start_codon:yes stop_codon:yes gene_type:complete